MPLSCLFVEKRKSRSHKLGPSSRWTELLFMEMSKLVKVSSTFMKIRQFVQTALSMENIKNLINIKVISELQLAEAVIQIKFHSLSLSICWAFDFFTTPLLSRLQLFIQIKNSLYGALAIIYAIVSLFLLIRKYATKTKLLFSCDRTQKIFMIFSIKIFKLHSVRHHCSSILRIIQNF